MEFENSDNIFAEIIKQKEVNKIKPITNLLNITFFLGAGFSKSWENNFPNSEQLFCFENKYLPMDFDLLDYFVISQGYETEKKINFKLFKEIVYNLVIQNKYPELRTRCMDQFNVELLQNELKGKILHNFFQYLPSKYRENNNLLHLPSNLSKKQKTIIDFFKNLRDDWNFHPTFPENIRFHFISTNYDWIIELIINKIIDDLNPLHDYVYRGFTPAKYNNSNYNIIHTTSSIINLFKLNGGFEIFQEGNNYIIDYSYRTIHKTKENPPVLVLPNKEQNYDEPYFRSIIPKAIRLLQESNILVLIGYSLPDEDAIFRFLIRQFAEHEGDLDKKLLFYIDKMKIEKQKSKLISIFPFLKKHEIDSSNVFCYSGDFSEWANNINQNLNK
ncbi:SIR2 family protein [candidate division KSB1 bacterium]|nr:SIR2 family protein [candidate division KSB1 bacterium]